MKSYLWSQKEAYHKHSFLVENSTVYTDDMPHYMDKFRLFKKESESKKIFYKNNSIQIAVNAQKQVISGHYNELDEQGRAIVFTYTNNGSTNVDEVISELIRSSQKIGRTISQKTIDEIKAVLRKYLDKRNKIRKYIYYLFFILLITLFILTIINYE